MNIRRIDKFLPVTDGWGVPIKIIYNIALGRYSFYLTTVARRNYGLLQVAADNVFL